MLEVQDQPTFLCDEKFDVVIAGNNSFKRLLLILKHA
jgi:hypothetical protein